MTAVLGFKVDEIDMLLRRGVAAVSEKAGGRFTYDSPEIIAIIPKMKFAIASFSELNIPLTVPEGTERAFENAFEKVKKEFLAKVVLNGVIDAGLIRKNNS